MAIVTPKMRRLMAESFLGKLADATTKNIYFFFGRSKPWVDPEAEIGVGDLTLAAGSSTLTITNGNFAGMPDSSTIKNLDNGEVRKVITLTGDPPTQALVNAPPGTPWSTGNWAWKEPGEGSVWKDDNNPPQPDGSQHNQYDTDITMLSLKRIEKTTLNDNMSYVVKRFDWDDTGETMYAMYHDNDGDLFNHPTQSDTDAADRWNASHPTNTYVPGSHWVVVNYGSNYHVYKCLDNGSRIDFDVENPYPKMVFIPNKSTEMPDKDKHTISNDYTHTYDDGYTWKFLYTLSADQVLKFLTDNWIPVKTAVDPDDAPSDAQNFEQWLVQENAKPGAIDIISVHRCDSPVVYYGDTVDGTTLLEAQPTLSNVEVQLPTSPTPSTEDNKYIGCDIFISNPSPARQLQMLRRVVDYVPSTRTVVVDAPWDVGFQPIEGDSVCIAPSVRISGVGEEDVTIEPCIARALVNPSGYINAITVLDKGQYYRLAQIKIMYQGASLTEQQVAFAEAEVSPIEGVIADTESQVVGGHGFNAVKELGGFHIMFFTQLHNIEGYVNPDESYDFIQANEYRSIGIVRNVQHPDGSYPEQEGALVEDTLKCIKTLTITTPNASPDFSLDEIIEFRDVGENLLARAYVVEYIRGDMNIDGTYNGILSYYQDLNTDFGEITTAGKVRGLSSGAETATIAEVVPAEINIFSGDILYIEQRKPVVRATEQIEDVKLVIEF